MVAGPTGSALFTTMRSVERSSPEMSSSRTFLRQSSKAKFGAAESVARGGGDGAQPPHGIGKEGERRHATAQLPWGRRCAA
jgi:hypothetical protein